MSTYSIKRFHGDMIRFGLSPGKMLNRFGSNAHAKIFCISIPKAGTHLLERAISLYGSYHRPFCSTMITSKHQTQIHKRLSNLKNGQFLVAHWRYSESIASLLSNLNIKTVFMVRDPRALVISHVKYLETQKKHPLHGHYKSIGAVEDKLVESICGSDEIEWPSLKARLKPFLGWLDNAYVIRFEDLVDASKNKKVIQDLFEYLGEHPDDNDLEYITSRLISSASPTFRGGKSSNWKSSFTDRVRNAFKQDANELLFELGYETSDDW